MPATTTQVATGADVTIQIEDGFQVDAAAGAGLDINATNSINVLHDAGTSSINGVTNGIDAYNTGAGAVSITAADVSGGDRGILAVNYGTDLTIDSTAGSVVGLSARGISTVNLGTGALSVTTGDVSSDVIGILAQNINGTDLVVDSSAGEVVGVAEQGVRTINLGSGSLTVTTGNVTGGLAGISAINGGTDLVIDTTDGAVIGGDYGIYAANFGSGSLTITTADVTGTNVTDPDDPSGIAARNFNGTDLTIDTTDGTVTGYQFGIYAANLGTGQLSITAGDVNATVDGGRGIYARNYGTDLNVDTTGGSIVAESAAIEALNYGTGSINIVTADVSSVESSAITASNFGENLFVNSSAGSLSGENTGVFAANFGSGELNVTTANVTATNGQGIFAFNDVYGTDLTIDSSAGAINTGTVPSDAYGSPTPYASGIVALNLGSGALNITSADVSAASNDGIYAFNSANGTDLTVDTSAGSVSTSAFEFTYYDFYSGSYVTQAVSATGINAINLGAGELNITTSDVSGADGAGIAALNFGTHLTINSSAGTVSGSEDGIAAVNLGGGNLTITTADVTGTNESGIIAANFGESLTVDSSAGDVSGAGAGIDALNFGTGALDVTTANVTGTYGSGIDAYNSAYGTDLNIDSSAGSVSGGTFGINAQNFGSSTLTIMTGDVSGNLNGIYARNSGTDLNIDSSAGSVSANANGIIAINDAPGSLSVITADVDSATSTAIFAIGAGTDLTIDSSAGTVSGQFRGINAQNYGSGTIDITTAEVIGGTEFGISAINRSSGVDLNIDSSAGSVSGATYGIYAFNGGSGSLSITSADVTATDGYGIFAHNLGADLNIDTSAGTVTADGNAAIFARNEGSGSLTITTGDIEHNGRFGIQAVNLGTDLIIDSSAGAINTNGIGILAGSLDGTGALQITTGDIGSVSGSAIAALSRGTDLTIDSSGGTLSAQYLGILARNVGTGALSITTANVYGNVGNGIEAHNYSGTDLTINSTAGSVSGGVYGIYAGNYGTGSLTITTADVTGTDAFGIYAFNAGTDLAIDSSAGTVHGGYYGIAAVNDGTGALDITSADVAATNSVGIFALNYGTDLTIDSSAGSVSGYYFGIYAINAGNGGLTITTGDVSAANGDAIRAANGTPGGLAAAAAPTVAAAGDLVVNTTGDVTASNDAVAVLNTTGTTYINNSGMLAGGRWSIFADAANTGAINVSNTGMIAGGVSLSVGDDVFNNEAGGTFLATIDSDFGTGNDVFNNLGTFAVNGTIAPIGLETFNNQGLITLVDNAADDILTISGDYVGGGELALDVNFATGEADVLVLQGTTTGTTNVVANVVTDGTQFGEQILLIDAADGTAEDAFSLSIASQSNSPFLTFGIDFDSAQSDFYISRILSGRVFETSKIAEAAQSLWYKSADAWADHRSNSRFAEETSPLWLVVYGAEADRDDEVTDTEFGTGTTSLDYDQDYLGFQTGYDLTGESFSFGLTAGYVTSELTFAANGDGARLRAANFGASAAYVGERFYAEALVKYDTISGGLRDRSGAGYDGDIDGDAYGARVQLGYRTSDEGFYVEPHGALEFQETDLDDLVVAGDSFDFDTVDGLRGSAGLRLGFQNKKSNGQTLGFYLDASVVHEFEGDTDVAFVTGSDRLEFSSSPIDTYGHFEAGVSLDGKGPISGFVQVEGDTSGDYSSYGGRAGVRFRF